MTDWHSHILPGVDDGSRNLSESLKMLDMMAEQGIKRVVATPHFLANKESVESFLERRNEAARLLRASMSNAHPELVLGAEVYYYPGISRMEGLERLCIEGTQLLLLEMPMDKWTVYTAKEVAQLSASGELAIALAHIERYIKLQSKEVWNKLYQDGVLMQVNASFFNELKTRHKALTMLKNRQIQFIGSDAHNTTSRPPCLGHAIETIVKKLGQSQLDILEAWESMHLAK